MAQDKWDRMAAIMRALDKAGVLDVLVEKQAKVTLEDLAAARRQELHTELTDPRPPQDKWGWTSKNGARLSVLRTRGGVLVDLNNHVFALPDNAVTSLMGWLAS